LNEVGHNILVSQCGDVYSWGIGKSGQLGLGDFNSTTEPTLITYFKESKEPVIAVSCGIAHTIFLLETGEIRVCGLNNYGQLGILSSNTTAVNKPARTIFFGPAEKISHVACGGAHSLIVDIAGTVFVSGSNSCGKY